LDEDVLSTLQKNNYLVDFSRSTLSQNGEEGILDRIFEVIGVGRDRGWCVEFGAYDGQTDCNTWQLVNERNWKAVYIECMPGIRDVLVDRYRSNDDVICFTDSVSWEGENTLDNILKRTSIPRDFELLVIDIDGNDYHVWDAFTRYAPRVVMIEYNYGFPHDVDFVQEKDPECYYGASVLALYELAKKKGYELVCITFGNCIFIRKEDFPGFDIENNHPSMMFRAPFEMKLFQLYDGSLYLAGFDFFIGLNQLRADGTLTNVKIGQDDIQVLPEGLREFRPRLTYRNEILDDHRGAIDRARVPENRLLEWQNDVTSENGEDGILEKIFDIIGEGGKYCVDVGANDSKTFSNTWNLINNKGWRGLLIEKDEAAFEKLTAEYEGNPNVKCMNALVTSSGKSRLFSLLKEAEAPYNFDLLCIDVEGNDFHIWRALYSNLIEKRHIVIRILRRLKMGFLLKKLSSYLSKYSPNVVLVDFNPSVPNDVSFVQEDLDDLHHGSSLAALVGLGKKNGYELAAVTTWNAIFVRSDLFPLLGIKDNRIHRMYYPIFDMKLLHVRDGTLLLRGCDFLVRQNYRIDHESIQVIPEAIRSSDWPKYTGYGKPGTVFYQDQ
tara:strand:+ start:1263 stop:3086 length:1824 start_codon:yes stop_codon:yes gene_type:complete